MDPMCHISEQVTVRRKMAYKFPGALGCHADITSTDSAVRRRCFSVPGPTYEVAKHRMQSCHAFMQQIATIIFSQPPTSTHYGIHPFWQFFQSYNTPTDIEHYTPSIARNNNVNLTNVSAIDFQLPPQADAPNWSLPATQTNGARTKSQFIT